MAVEFDESAQQLIDFGLVPALHNLEQKTVMVFFALDSIHPTGSKIFMDKGFWLATSGWSLYQTSQDAVVNRLGFVHSWTGNFGTWSTDDNVLTTSVRDFAITYDRGATANDPILYVDGVSVNVNETLTPAGIVDDDSGQDFWMGGLDNIAFDSMDGIINGVFVWDRLLSAEAIAEISNHRTVRGHRKGLVWGCRFVGASGLQVYDGAVLAGGNKFVDMIDGVQGTPTGSPVGRADIYMAYR